MLIAFARIAALLLRPFSVSSQLLTSWTAAGAAIGVGGLCGQTEGDREEQQQQQQQWWDRLPHAPLAQAQLRSSLFLLHAFT